MFLLNFPILVEFFRVCFFFRGLSFSKISQVYAYLGAYAYSFGELFQGLCLFGGLRLLGSLEYLLKTLKIYALSMVVIYRVESKDRPYVSLMMAFLATTQCKKNYCEFEQISKNLHLKFDILYKILLSLSSLLQ